MNRIFEMDAEAFRGFCHARGLKCTVQRIAVFEVLRRLRSHPAVDEVWERAKRRAPSVTRESVYRILNEFSELGVLRRMDSLSAARYDTHTEPHAHFICEGCGQVVDYPLPEGFALPKGMPASRRHVELRVTGLCAACAGQSQAGDGGQDDFGEEPGMVPRSPRPKGKR